MPGEVSSLAEGNVTYSQIIRTSTKILLQGLGMVPWIVAEYPAVLGSI